VARRLKSIDVIDVLSDLFILRGVPGHIRSDNVLSGESRADFGQADLVARGSAGRRSYCDPSGLH
jgi:putative transposase